MNFLRNIFGISVGLAVAGLIISAGIQINPKWAIYEDFDLYKHWETFLKSVKNDRGFYWFLLFISGLATTFGGVATALIVKYAKVAYAILIGFIMLFLAVLDIVIFPYHPTFYKILIFLTFFPFAWIGGKIVDVIYQRKNSRLKVIKQKNTSGEVL